MTAKAFQKNVYHLFLGIPVSADNIFIDAVDLQDKGAPMSRTRIVFFACLAVALGFVGAIGLAELSMRIHLYFTENGGESIAARDLALGYNPFDILHGLEGCSWPESLYPHPRYGFVQQGTLRCGWPISNLSVYGHDLPEEKDPNLFVVLVLGGPWHNR